MTLTFPVAAQPDFGEAFIGYSTELPFRIENRGTETLEVFSITSDRPEFGVSPHTFTLSPGGSEEITVSFTPSSAEEFVGTLSIHSNDPDEALTPVSASGIGVPAPAIEVSPAVVESSLLVGEQSDLPLTVLNTGEGALQFEVMIADPIGFLSIDTGRR